MAALQYWVWLSELNGVNHVSKLKLLQHFGSPEDIYYAAPEDYGQVEGISREQIELLEQKSLQRADWILKECAREKIFLVTMDDVLYPLRLKDIYDPPILLYGKGKMPLFDDEVVVSMVGTRSCTPYGVSCAESLGYELARQGAMVLSGMAKGIDAASLRGALRAGSFTCAVLGCGVDVVYPAENRRLYEDILATGVILSEYPPKTEPEPWRFPQRNRIMSGLSVAALVVEAPERSGALITAGDALEQGREVFAVPGPINAPSSRGCHRLIREGAGLVSCAWDLLSEFESRYPHRIHSDGKSLPEMPPQSGEPKKNAEEKKAEEKKTLPMIDGKAAGLTDDQIAVLRILKSEEAMLSDEVAEETEIPVRRVLSALTMLEIDGHVKKTGAQSFVRAVEIK